jgi:hypothetical protein
VLPRATHDDAVFRHAELYPSPRDVEIPVAGSSSSRTVLLSVAKDLPFQPEPRDAPMPACV